MMCDSVSIEIVFEHGQAFIWEWIESEEAYRVICRHSKEDLTDELYELTEDFWQEDLFPGEEHQ